MAGAAAAQDGGLERCDETPRREPVEVTPAVGAQGVTLDAPLRVRYSPGFFEPGGPGVDPPSLLRVERCATGLCDPLACLGGGEFVPGRVQVVGDELAFFPDAPWLVNATYGGIARGIDSDLQFSFCSGTSNDVSAPRIGPLREVRSTAVGPRCEAREGGFRIDVFFSPAEDVGGPPGSIEYLLYQTRGASITEPVLRARARNFAGTDTVMAFVLPQDEAQTPICVRVAAVDGVGNVVVAAESAQDCVDPVQGTYFYGLCSASPRRAPAPWLGAVLFALAALRRARHGFAKR